MQVKFRALFTGCFVVKCGREIWFAAQANGIYCLKIMLPAKGLCLTGRPDVMEITEAARKGRTLPKILKREKWNTLK